MLRWLSNFLYRLGALLIDFERNLIELYTSLVGFDGPELM